MAQAGGAPRAGALYGVWAPRSGGTGAHLVEAGDGAVLSGTVRFRPGARTLDRALVVALGRSGWRLVDLPLDAEGIRRVLESWHAVGMAASDSNDGRVPPGARAARALARGPGFYPDRPGLWWGGGGVVAVWLGGAAGVLDDVHAVLRGTEPDPHQRAQLGELHTALALADALLVRTAALIDAESGLAHRTPLHAARAALERCCRMVLDVDSRGRGCDCPQARCTVERLMRQLGLRGACRERPSAPPSPTRARLGPATWWDASSLVLIRVTRGNHRDQQRARAPHPQMPHHHTPPRARRRIPRQTGRRTPAHVASRMPRTRAEPRYRRAQDVPSLDRSPGTTAAR